MANLINWRGILSVFIAFLIIISSNVANASSFNFGDSQEESLKPLTENRIKQILNRDEVGTLFDLRVVSSYDCSKQQEIKKEKDEMKNEFNKSKNAVDAERDKQDIQDSQEEKEEKWDFCPQEMDLYARLVHAEARGEPFKGQVAVAASILNRLECEVYPDELESMIYEVIAGYHQFCPVKNGRINQPANDKAFKAIEEALRGEEPSRGAISFYNPQKSSNQWVRQQKVTAVIGNHVFFKLAK